MGIPWHRQYDHQLQFDSWHVENHFYSSWRSVFLQIWYSDSQDTSLQKYGTLDPKAINNTFDTGENGTATCIKGNAHDVIGIGK